MLKHDSAWSLVPPDPTDPNKDGILIKRSFKGATLFVGSDPYTAEFQKQSPMPGVDWIMSVFVR
jgi:hypothetical protein